MSKHIKRIVLTLLTVLFVSGNAAAAKDYKSFPGSSCVPMGGYGNPYVSPNMAYDQFGMAVAGSLRDGEGMFCPIVRDSSSHIGKIWVRFQNTTSEKATCRAYSASSLGTSWDTSATHSVTGSDKVSIPGSELNAYSGGAYYVYCNVPSFAKIVGTLWEETESTADNKVIPGLMCQSRVNKNQGFYMPNGSFLSNFTSTQIACPLVRDQNSGSVDDVFVRMANYGGSDTVNCSLFSQAASNASYDSSDEAIFSSSGEYSMYLDADTVTHWSGGSFAVRCNIGESTRIVSIRYNE